MVAAFASAHLWALARKDTEAFLSQVKDSYPKLSFLSLLGNTACPNELVLKDEDDYQRYRYYVLHTLPGLKFLDSRGVSDKVRVRVLRITNVLCCVGPPWLPAPLEF